MRLGRPRATRTVANVKDPDDRRGKHHVAPGTSSAWEVPAGAAVRVVDVEGSQVADVFLVDGADPSDGLSNGRTFDYNGTVALTRPPSSLTTSSVTTSSSRRAARNCSRSNTEWRAHTRTATPISPRRSRVRGARIQRLSKAKERRKPLTRERSGSPDRIRTGVSGLKGRRPRPLDDGTGAPTRLRRPAGQPNSPRARSIRAIVRSRPNATIDSNNGGLTDEPVTATRKG